MTEHEKAFPFDSVEDGLGVADRPYYAEDFASYFAQFLGNGVYPNPSTNLQVQSLNNNMVLTVLQGSAFIKGYGYINKEPLLVTVSTANGAYNRIDLIVVQLSLVEREIKVIYKEGIPSSSPVKPTLVRNDDVYELQLAQVLVKSGVQLITQANITDTRPDTALCGIVSAVVKSVDTATLFQQYENYLHTKMAEWDATKAQQGADFESQMTGQEETFAREFGQRKSSFDAWFSGARAEIVTLQSFYYQNWAELAGCIYTDYPKDSTGKFISTITQAETEKLIARQTEWTEGGKINKSYFTKIEVFAADGVTILKEATRKEYENAMGIWKGEVTT